MFQRTPTDRQGRGASKDVHSPPDREPQPAEHALARLRGGAPSSSRPRDALRMQSSIGNQATRRLLGGATPTSSPPAPTLELGAHDDAFEREAHALARQATSASSTPTQRPTSVPRGGGLGPVAPAIAARIHGARGGGRPLPTGVQTTLGQRMGADFDRVRVHTDPRADALSRSLGALAFTTGPDIFFRHGHYDPASPRGRTILAHEMAHVAQQTGGPPRIQRYFELSGDQVGDDGLVTSDHASFPVQQEGLAAGLARRIKEAILDEDDDLKNQLVDELEASVSADLRNEISAVRADNKALRALLFTKLRAFSYYEAPIGLEDTGKLRLASKTDTPPLLVSDNGHIAVEKTAINEQAKTAFARATDVAASNEALKDTSRVKLVTRPDQKLTVPNWDNSEQVELVQVYAARRDEKHKAPLPDQSSVADLSAEEEQLINSLVTPEQCIATAEFVVGAGLEDNVVVHQDADKLPSSSILAATGMTLSKYIMVYMRELGSGSDADAAATVATQEATDLYLLLGKSEKRFTRNYNRVYVAVSGYKAETNAKALFKELAPLQGSRCRPDKPENYVSGSGSTWQVDFWFDPVIADDDADAFAKLKANGLDIPTIVNKYKYGIVRSATITTSFVPAAKSDEKYLPDGTAVSALEERLGRELADLKETPEFAGIAEKFGINEYASPEIGQAYASHRTGKAEGAPYHWAGVILKDGYDTLVLENYQRGSKRENDLRAFFTIYGRWRAYNTDYDPKTWQKGTWYSRHAPDYPGIATVHKPKDHG